MDDFLIDIICPLYNGKSYFEGIIKGIQSQKNVKINHLVFPLTKTDDGMEEILKKKQVTYFTLDKSEFSHSLTREKAIREYCSAKVVVLLSQDVIFTNEFVLYNLVKDIFMDKCALSFARQICTKRTIERYTREKNYPKKSYFVSRDDVSKMQLKTFFCSDACAAYNRDVFIEIGGYGKDLSFGEDMYYAQKALFSGYSMKYCADSIVDHSHDFNIKELYRRYYKTGEFFKENPQLGGYETTRIGAKLALYMFFRAIKEFNIKALLQFFPNVIARYIGMKKGGMKE